MCGLQEDETENIGDFLLPTCLVSEGSCIAYRPTFWIEFGGRLGKALLSLAWRYVSKRMPPDEEAAWRQAERRG